MYVKCIHYIYYIHIKRHLKHFKLSTICSEDKLAQQFCNDSFQTWA